METNALPAYDAGNNPTGCCPRFNPEGWDGQDLHFEDKLFLRARTTSVDYVPMDMGPVFERTFAAIQKAGAYDEKDFIVLSRDLSPSEAEHYFAVAKEVPDQEVVRWSGDYLTKLFEGPYEKVPEWEQALLAEVKHRGRETSRTYFFYTTCPKCAAAYGKNYVVAVAALAEDGAQTA